VMALPYTIVLTLVGLFCVEFALQPMTELFYHWGWLSNEAASLLLNAAPAVS
ncbi:MAG TPA: hypothetical protein DCF88_13790, partial [Plesiomonas shigelloides]|nr:hypothetical protein [Plesiomonas shigelloides]